MKSIVCYYCITGVVGYLLIKKYHSDKGISFLVWKVLYVFIKPHNQYIKLLNHYKKTTFVFNYISEELMALLGNWMGDTF